ncbi:helix-turn-helix domain-containing protein [Runella sp. CRIBMP]|uniref:helix-turn-helix transcriptional regulator n=1 Tax=Runella sp. CRIBMP TaxID=2683261 RepID=UPI001411CCFD|nr:helix-turn-helix transcriptional regulator [Runella sp. CRIBMP]NBB23389.1 helix-turn-helix domain-containing protein [Runella sp. CRIBMP]
MASIKSDFCLTYFKRKPFDEPSGARVKNNLKLFDFGSDYTYFFSILPKNNKDLRALTDSLQNIIEGEYCLISIFYDHGRPFVMGIRTDWLINQVGNLSSDLDDFIPKVLSNWNNQYSLFTLRYSLFHKEYQQAVNPDLLAKSYFFQFILLFIDDLYTQILSKTAKNFKEIDLRRIKEVEAQITYDFKKSTPSINEMAKMAGMSVSKFKILFSELFSTSPHQHILDKKMMYAQGLLQTGKYSITQVAYQVGYHHPSSFTRVFKQKFNYSPNTSYFEKW